MAAQLRPRPGRCQLGGRGGELRWDAVLTVTIIRLPAQRNFALRPRRSAERRRAREASAARPEADDTGADSASERFERHRELVGALDELAADARELLLLRYFEGQAPREIARRRGLSSEVVRKRLSRAREALRAKLDERHGGDRAAWCALVAQAFDFEVGASGAGDRDRTGGRTGCSSSIDPPWPGPERALLDF